MFAVTFASSNRIIVSSAFDVAYIENLINLSIAAVYPICFLALSGEMKTSEMSVFRMRTFFLFQRTPDETGSTKFSAGYQPCPVDEQQYSN